MFSWFKKKKVKQESEKQIDQPQEYDFKWYDIGEENPFNKRILDIRCFTGTMVATTSDKNVAERYNQLRGSIGEEYIGVQVPDSISSNSDLRYPHNGAEVRGAAFKADSMDCKWDIYVYDDYFYFTRSWTGELIYKAKAEIGIDQITIKQVEHGKNTDPNDAINDVHFLIVSHATGQPFTHKIPKELTKEKDIAIWSFSQFGNRACYATYEDIIDTKIRERE